jgi:hypothetical protein
MHQKHLLRFIKSKLKKEPDELVIFRYGQGSVDWDQVGSGFSGFGTCGAMVQWYGLTYS